ncbi:MAG: UDP-2,3-diacylglucosamine diphosphatase [Candidatus Bathyarchaeia archaeon]|jgi:UDP-2,3-diacylglucosamine pyrophosphatase LpxH
MKVVVTSDQHLGYANSDKAAFNAFLDNLSQRSDVTHLVLLGDVVDMWRRDASGVFLEHHDTVTKLLALKSKGVQIFYVAGNHDYHVVDLTNPAYPFKFLKELTLTDGPVTYRLVHGYEFDPEQKIPFMAFLCRVMSDTGGAFESNLWVDFHSAKTILSKMEPSFVKADLAKVAQRLHQRPEDRLKGSINKINSTACNSVKPGEVLVFGHTHVPFINKAENVANTGSWVKDAAVYNTYVELSGGKPKLFVFGGQEITDRTESSQLQPHSSITSRIRKMIHPADIK